MYLTHTSYSDAFASELLENLEEMFKTKRLYGNCHNNSTSLEG